MSSDGVDTFQATVASLENPQPTVTEGRRSRGRRLKSGVTEEILPLTQEYIEVEDDEDIHCSRVFVERAESGSGVHLDWPVYAFYPITPRCAARIVYNDAAEVSPGAVCLSIPQEYTESGTFVVNTGNSIPRHEIFADGLGRWGEPHESYATYDVNGKKLPLSMNWHHKVICHRFVHPGTDRIGRFVKNVFSGEHVNGEIMNFVVITYEWRGEPHPISVELERNQLLPTESRPWHGREEKARRRVPSWNGLPLYSEQAIDFDSVCQLLLGAVHVEPQRICGDVPVDFLDTATFIVDIAKAGGESRLAQVGGRWSKPSGASRFFRMEEPGQWLRVDSPGHPSKDPHGYVIQIFSKRYASETHPGFMRKVFVMRERERVDGKLSTATVASNLAIITFYFRIALRRDVPSGLLPNDIPQEIDVVPDAFGAYADHEYGQACTPSEALKLRCLEKQWENIERFLLFLQRAESVLDKFQALGRRKTHPERLEDEEGGPKRTRVGEDEVATGISVQRDLKHLTASHVETGANELGEFLESSQLS